MKALSEAPRRARTLQAAGLAITALLALAGCSRDEPAAATAREDNTRQEPVVVYADAPGEDVLNSVFGDFTAQTGMRVTVRAADAARNLADVMGNTGAPPADILLTDNVADIWLAADEGALRKLAAASGIGNVPAEYKDPDGQWFALGIKRFVVVSAADADITMPESLEALTEPGYGGQLCLSSTTEVHNLELIAQLIETHGLRPAEIIVRQWMQNLALPPFETSGKLLDAVAAGSCPLAIVQDQAVAARSAEFSDSPPVEVYASAFAAGIARHARYPEIATELLAWLQSDAGQSSFASAAAAARLDALPRPAHALTALGWQREEARLLAERARWR